MDEQDLNSDSEQIQLMDPEANTIYTLEVSSEDALRLKTDMPFAKRLLKRAMIKYKSEGNSTKIASSDDEVEVSLSETDIPINASEHSTQQEKKIWAHDETLRLISAVETHFDDLSDSKKRKQTWETISNEFESKTFNVTPSECNKKWLNLVRTYKTCKDNIKKTGRRSTRFHFFEKMDELLGVQPSKSGPDTIDVYKLQQHSPTAEEPQPSTSKRTPRKSLVKTNDDVSPENSFYDHGDTSEDGAAQVGGKKRRRNATVEYFKAKQRSLEKKEADAELKLKDRKLEKAVKLQLLERKLDIEERKAKALETLVKLKQKESKR